MLFSGEDNSLHIEDMTPHHIVSCATITGSPFQYILGVYFEDQRAPTPKDNPEPSYGRVFCPSDIRHTVRISPLRSHLIFFLIIQFVCEIIMGKGTILFIIFIIYIYKPSASRLLLLIPGDPKHSMQDKNLLICFLNESSRSNSLELFGGYVCSQQAHLQEW